MSLRLRLAAPAVAVATLLSWTLLPHCADLQPLTPGVCGNGVINPGEDCDGTFDAAGTLACGAPDAGAQACRFTCPGSTPCPGSYNCGLDGICRQPTGAFVPLGQPIAVGARSVALADFNGDGFADALTAGDINGEAAERIQVNYLGASGSVLGTFAIADRLELPQVTDLNGDGLADIVTALRVSGATGVTFFLGQADMTLASQPFPTAVIPSSLAVDALTLSGFANGSSKLVFLVGGASDGGASDGGTIFYPGGNGLPVLGANGSPFPDNPATVVGPVALAQPFTGSAATASPCPSLVYETLTGLARVVPPCVVEASGKTQVSPPASSLPIPATVGGGCACTGCVAPACQSCAANSRCSAGAQVGDVNGDGNPDLVFSATKTVTDAGISGNEFATYVAYGNGEGRFTKLPPKADAGAVHIADGGALPPLPAFNLLIEANDGEVVSETINETYAVGDVNGDGVADFVANAHPYATASSGPGNGFVTLLVSNLLRGNAPPVYDFTGISLESNGSAVIADFSGDGFGDVAASSNVGSGIHFYEGATLADGDYVQHLFIIDTGGATSHLTVGDFDGDGVLDLGFAQVDPVNSSHSDLEIAYGRQGGPPDTPVLVGEFASISEIAATVPYTEIDVVGVPLGQTSQALVRFATESGGRPPLASQALLPPDASAGPHTPLAAFAALFQTASAQDASASAQVFPSIAAVGRGSLGASGGQGDYLWSIPIVAGATGSSISFGTPVPSGVALPDAAASFPQLNTASDQTLLMTAAPLTQNAPASLVILGDNAAQGADASAPADFLLATENGSAAPLSLTGGGGGAEVFLPFPGGAGSGGYASVWNDGQTGLADLNGDGAQDLIVLTGTSGFCGEVQGSAAAARRSLLVYWGEASGGFNLDAPATVASCPSGCVVDLNACPAAFTLVAATRSALPSLAYVTSDSLVLASFGPADSGAAKEMTVAVPIAELRPTANASVAADADTFDSGPPLPQNLLGVTGVSSGDINGDGVADLAVVVEGSLYLFAGVPTLR